MIQILLRGANGDELKKVKHVVQYGVFAAYHLALETSFLADEGASLPVLPLESPITVALPDKSSNIDRSISTVPGFSVPVSAKSPGPQSVGEPQRLNSAPNSDLVEATTVSLGENKCERPPELPANMIAPYVPPLAQSIDEGFQPFLLNEASADPCLADFSASLGAGSEAGRLATEGVSRIINDFRAVQSEILDSDANRSVQQNEKQIPEEQPPVKEEFLPPSSDNQSILVSLSSRCVWKGTVCERSHLFRIKYYGNFDKPLGRFLRDDLFDQVSLFPLDSLETEFNALSSYVILRVECPTGCFDPDKSNVFGRVIDADHVICLQKLIFNAILIGKVPSRFLLRKCKKFFYPVRRMGRSGCGTAV